MQIDEIEKQAILQTLAELVGVRSVSDSDAAQPGAPFGPEAARGLAFVAKAAGELGMTVREFDGYAIDATLGEGLHLVGALCHADVVPEGRGWDTDPFVLTQKGGKLYGRGASDDKGPLVATLFAMARLSRKGAIPQGCRLRLIVGSDEEVGWNCIAHYLECADELPEYSIVPDSNFPLINCEKGLLDFDLTFGGEESAGAPVRLVGLDCRGSRNVVPDAAGCLLECSAPDDVIARLSTVAGFEARATDGSHVEMLAHGHSAHAMTPEKGENALGKLFSALAGLGRDFSHAAFVQRYVESLGAGTGGEGCGLAMSDEASGGLTLNVGAAELEPDGSVRLECNLRYPATAPAREVLHRTVAAFSRLGFTYRQVDHLPAVNVDEQSDFVQMLMDVYRKHTGDHDSGPLAIGGATYARALPNAVGFGPLFPWEEELAHEPNEYIELDDLLKLVDMYEDALAGMLGMCMRGGAR